MDTVTKTAPIEWNGYRKSGLTKVSAAHVDDNDNKEGSHDLLQHRISIGSIWAFATCAVISLKGQPFKNRIKKALM